MRRNCYIGLLLMRVHTGLVQKLVFDRVQIYGCSGKYQVIEQSTLGCATRRRVAVLVRLCRYITPLRAGIIPVYLALWGYQRTHDCVALTA
jgi:hypothetical protein